MRVHADVWLRAVSSPSGPRGPAVRGVAHTLALFAGGRNRASPGRKQLAECAGTSVSALARYLIDSSLYEFVIPGGRLENEFLLRRQSLGLSQDRLAALAGVSGVMISFIERGQHVGGRAARKVAQVLLELGARER